MNKIYQEYISCIEKCELFSGISKDEAEILASSMQTMHYHRGETIRGNGNDPGSICFIISGTASVMKGKTVISILSDGDMFGAVELYGNIDTVPSVITAKTECTVVMISREAVENVVKSDYNIARNYLGYLSGRIVFLTDRLETVTGGTSTEKLENLLLSSDTGSADCSNMSVLAKKLDMSRASLYRAIESLESKNIIRREDNKIILRNEE